MNTDNSREERNISARMMNDATGTVRTVRISGCKRNSTALTRAAMKASSMPKVSPSAAPSVIREKVKTTAR